jgi:uncharacterized protein (TIGR03790 family)
MAIRALECGRAALLQLTYVLSYRLSLALCGALFTTPAQAAAIPAAARVLLVVNDNSPVSRTIGEYYARRRGVPAQNICHLRAPVDEEIGRSDYDRLAAAVSACLRSHNLVESVYYIVTTLGDPLKVSGSSGLNGDAASVDSELTLLYSELKGALPHRTAGSIPNPFFGKSGADFSHPEFPMYVVTRLAAYDFDGVKTMIDRAMEAANRGKFVIDMSEGNDAAGEKWLRDAAAKLPKDRVELDETSRPLYDQTGVIGYASWGSNDAHHNRRFPNFRWLPGAIATEYVSSDGRTFQRPPQEWVPSNKWDSPALWFARSPQSLSADFILEGATGASGHVYEPYLNLTPHPDVLLPAYYSGRNLAESFYLSIPALSWQNIVLGDPLCALGKPR